MPLRPSLAMDKMGSVFYKSSSTMGRIYDIMEMTDDVLGDDG